MQIHAHSDCAGGAVVVAAGDPWVTGAPRTPAASSACLLPAPAAADAAIAPPPAIPASSSATCGAAAPLELPWMPALGVCCSTISACSMRIASSPAGPRLPPAMPAAASGAPSCDRCSRCGLVRWRASAALRLWPLLDASCTHATRTLSPRAPDAAATAAVRFASSAASHSGAVLPDCTAASYCAVTYFASSVVDALTPSALALAAMA